MDSYKFVLNNFPEDQVTFDSPMKIPLWSSPNGEYLMMIRNNAGKLSVFIQNLLEVARIEQAKLDLSLTPANLNDILKEVVRLLASPWLMRMMKIER